MTHKSGRTWQKGPTAFLTRSRPQLFCPHSLDSIASHKPATHCFPVAESYSYLISLSGKRPLNALRNPYLKHYRQQDADGVLPALQIAMPPKAAATRRTATRQTEGSEATTAPSTGAETTPAPTNAPEASSTPAQSATPGPSGRPSVQRLQSLKKRGGQGSITPSARSPSALGGEGAKPKLKYQPKNVGRRSKEEREALQKLEEERNNERLKEAAAIQRARGAGRGGRGAFRGRGGPAGMGGSGPLGSGAGLGGARRGRGGGGPFGAGAVGRGRTRSAYSGGSRPPMDEDSDEYESEVRVDINAINEMESEDELVEHKDIKGKLPYRPKGERGLKPHRVHRIEHEERVVSVNMESSSSRSAELRKQAGEEEEAPEGDVAAPAEVEATEEPPVKAEPVEDQDTTMMDAVPHAEDDGFLPTQSVRVRQKVPPSPQKAKAKKGTAVKAVPKRDPRELLRTKEEIDEYDRHLEDLEHVRKLLHHEEPKPTAGEPQPEEPQTLETTQGEEPEERATEAQEEGEEQEEDKASNPLLGQLFLMQFPPMTPNLTIPGTLTSDQPVPEPTPASAPQNEIKTEGNEPQIIDADAAQPKETPKVVTAATDWSLPAGRVGKLNVHKSGRVTMDWGGISFELDRAAAVDFVQEALIVSSLEADEPGQPVKEESTEHRAWSMGQLSGKFTVMPNWDEML